MLCQMWFYDGYCGGGGGRGRGCMGAGRGSLSYMTGEGETVSCDGALMTIIEGE